MLTRKQLLLLAFVVALFLGLGVTTHLWLKPPAPTTQAYSGAVHFNLTDHHGRAVTENNFSGKVNLVFFGFTACMDVCPTTLGYLSALLEDMGPEKADQLYPLFISVDPERDSIQKLADYISGYHKNFIALTGTPPQVAEAAKSFGAYYKKVPINAERYAMDHSVTVYLVDKKGQLAGQINSKEPLASARQKLEAMLTAQP